MLAAAAAVVDNLLPRCQAVGTGKVNGVAADRDIRAGVDVQGGGAGQRGRVIEAGQDEDPAAGGHGRAINIGRDVAGRLAAPTVNVPVPVEGVRLMICGGALARGVNERGVELNVGRIDGDDVIGGPVA